MAEPTLGLVPDLGGTHPLVHAVGYARAVEICLTGRRVGAAEAVAIGLAQRQVPGAELDAAVRDRGGIHVVEVRTSRTDLAPLLASIAAAVRAAI